MTAPVAVLAVMAKLISFKEQHAEYEPRANHEGREAIVAMAELIEVLGDIVKADDAALLQLASIGMKPAAGDPAVALTERARAALARVGAAP